MKSSEYTTLLGARVRSELNDLKRTPEACATELELPLEEVEKMLSGETSREAMLKFIDLLGKSYPIDIGDLMLPEDDCERGVRFVSAKQSQDSARIFDRKDRNGDLTPYYDYRDTAMSCLAPFKPEWIKELRVVSDADPENPDIAYNHGHFMHQLTFFVGPVNFYYEIDGKKHGVEMNTGDSNFIMPFFPHSFASRSEDEDAIIIAVTFGGDVRRAQKEIYSLGNRAMDFRLNGRASNYAARVSLLKQHLALERVSNEIAVQQLQQRNADFTLEEALDEERELAGHQYELLAEMLNVEVQDLLFSPLREGEDVVVTRFDEKRGLILPSNATPGCRIYPLSRNRKMPLLKAFNIEVTGSESFLSEGFAVPQHTYLFNYGAEPVRLEWEFEGNSCEEILRPDDSAYLQPFIRHSFSRASENIGKLLSVSIPGAMNLTAQREFSLFASAERVIRETGRWY